MKRDNKSKAILYFLVAFSLTFLYFNPLKVMAVSNFPEPSKSFYVYDEANLLSPETEKFIIDVNIFRASMSTYYKNNPAIRLVSNIPCD